MARRSALHECRVCGESAELGVYLGFYVFGSDHVRKQKRDTLPSRGYCIRCFLDTVERRNLDAGRLKRIYDQLGVKKELPDDGT